MTYEKPRGWVKIWSKCDPVVAEAVTKFQRNISESHTWKSKTYSLISLSRQYLDEPVIGYFASNDVFAGQLSFSDYLRRGRTAALAWLDLIAVNHFMDIELSCYESLSDTLGTLRDVVIVCSNLKSRDGRTRIVGDEEDGVGVVRKRASRAKGKSKIDRIPQYLKDFLGLIPGVYCEVCDQLTEHHLTKIDYTLNDFVVVDGIMIAVDEMEILIKGKSKKYCEKHERRKNPVEYKKANRARKAFYSLMCIKREGEKLLYGRSSTQHGKLRSDAYQVIQSTSHWDLKMAISVVEKYFESIPESVLDEQDRKNEMLNAYNFYFKQ